MVIGHIAISMTIPLSVYLRAHKKEPIAHLSFLSGILTLILSYYISIKIGIIGIGLGFMISQLLVFPFIVLVYKKEKKIYENSS